MRWRWLWYYIKLLVPMRHSLPYGIAHADGTVTHCVSTFWDWLWWAWGTDWPGREAKDE